MFFNKHTKYILFSIILLLGVIFVNDLISYSNGITNVYDGCYCHGSNNTATSIDIEVEQGTTISVDEEVDINVTISNSTLSHWGTNIAVTTTENGSTLAGTLTAGTGLKLQSNQLTHNGKQSGSGDFTFSFKWEAPSEAGTYYVRVSGNSVNNNGGTSGDQPNIATLAITVEEMPYIELTSMNGGGKYCATETVEINWNEFGAGNVTIAHSSDSGDNYDNVIASGITASLGTYNWEIPSNLIGTSNNRIRVISESDPTIFAFSNIDFEINATPEITSISESVEICQGEDVVLSVEATGGNLNYTWKRNNQTLPNSNNPTYNITNANNLNSGDYTVDISNGCGNTLVSDVINVKVNLNPIIVENPQSKQVCLGSDLTLSVKADGSDLAYQWYHNDNMLSGQNTETLLIPNYNASMEGEYYVTVTSNACSVDANSSVATISTAETTDITKQPESLGLCLGSEAILSVEANGSSLTYQWQKNGTNITGAVGSTYVIESVQPEDAADYTVIVIGLCEPELVSEVAKLEISDVPEITQSPESQTVTVGESVTFIVAASSNANSFEWYKNDDLIATTTENELTIESVSLADASDNYRVDAINNCGSVSSAAFELIVADPSDPVLSVSPSNINFDIVTIGNVETRTFSITNAGVGELIITSISIAGSSANQFEISEMELPFSIFDDQAIDIDVTFEPVQPLNHVAVITVSTSDGQSRNVNLTAAGRVGEEFASVNYPLGLTITKWDGSDDSKVEIEITNNGPDAFSISDVILSNSEGLTVDIQNTNEIQPLESVFVTISLEEEVQNKEVDVRILFDGTDEEINFTFIIDIESSVLDVYSNLTIYPNPASNEVNITFENATANVSNLKLFNLMGIEILTMEEVGDNVKINSSGLEPGMYFLTIEYETGNSSIHKLIVD